MVKIHISSDAATSLPRLQDQAILCEQETVIQDNSLIRIEIAFQHCNAKLAQSNTSLQLAATRNDESYLIEMPKYIRLDLICKLFIAFFEMLEPQ